MSSAAPAATSVNENTEEQQQDVLYTPELLDQMDRYVEARISFLASRSNFEAFLASRNILMSKDEKEKWDGKVYRELFESGTVSLKDLLDKSERLLNDWEQSDFEEGENLHTALLELRNFYMRELEDLRVQYVKCLERQLEIVKKTDNRDIEKTLRKPCVRLSEIFREKTEKEKKSDEVEEISDDEEEPKRKRPRVDLHDTDDEDDEGNLIL